MLRPKEGNMVCPEADITCQLIKSLVEVIISP